MDRDDAAVIASLRGSARRHTTDAAYYRGQAADATDPDVRAAFEQEATDADARAARRRKNVADVRAGRD